MGKLNIQPLKSGVIAYREVNGKIEGDNHRHHTHWEPRCDSRKACVRECERIMNKHIRCAFEC